MKRWKSATRGRFADLGRDAHAGEVQDVLHQRSDLEFGEKQHWKKRTLSTWDIICRLPSSAAYSTAWSEFLSKT